MRILRRGARALACVSLLALGESSCSDDVLPLTSINDAATTDIADVEVDRVALEEQSTADTDALASDEREAPADGGSAEEPDISTAIPDAAAISDAAAGDDTATDTGATDSEPPAADDVSNETAPTGEDATGSDDSTPGDEPLLADDAATPAEPDAPATDADRTSDGAACIVPAGAPSCIADGPCATRPDVAIRKLVDVEPGSVRIAVDPLTHAIHYLNLSGDIHRLDGDTPVLAYSGADVGATTEVEGMAFGPDGTLYVVANVSSPFTFQAVIRAGIPNPDGSRTWSTLATTDPIPQSNTPFDHHFNGIVVSPDGRYVFVNSGSRTDHGELQEVEGMFPGAREVPLTSAVFRIPATVSGTVLPDDEALLRSGGYLFADGTRNAFAPTFAPNGDLVAGDNGPDADYPEELNILREGAHYGFPWRLSDLDNPQQFPAYDPASDHLLVPGFTAVDAGFYTNDPTFPPPPPGVVFVDPLRNAGPDAVVYRDSATGLERNATADGQTLSSFTPHRVPLGLAFDPGGVLCGDYAGGLFVLSFGSSGGTLSDMGRDLELVHFTGPDAITSSRVVDGFGAPIDEVLVENKLYVLDYGLGAIWEVTLPRAP